MAFLDPERVLAEVHLDPNMTAVDVGSGSGAYVLWLARFLKDGVVYAVDVQEPLLVRLKNNAAGEHLSNIEVIHADAERGVPLRDSLADLVVFSNLLFQVGEKASLFKEAFRLLKKGGFLLVVDWSDSFGGLGPKPEDVVSKAKVIQFGSTAGLVVIKEFDAGDHHYGVVFKKS